MIHQLFIELIQVSIGYKVCLSYTPSADEWGELYSIAKKQSLVGVCFAGVKKLVNQRQEPPEMLYLSWMGMAAKIQQRNEVVNRQCVELQKRLADDGMQSAILKGQGVGALYHASFNTNLSLLRQSGDIDIWVSCGMQKALEYVNRKYGECEYDYINAHVPCYQDTEVELHWRVQSLSNLIMNRRLQRWLESPEIQRAVVGGNITLADGHSIVVPTAVFNAFYILLHCYHHMMDSGLGLRQLMDYYFVLKSFTFKPEDKEYLTRLFKKFGIKKFASAVMWLMMKVFGLSETMLICEPSEHDGIFIRTQVMETGNFGHYDERILRIGKGKVNAIMSTLQYNVRLLSHYPSEMLWNPLWIIWHFIWKRTSAKLMVSDN